MGGQAGFWDIVDRYARLSEAGDPLEKLNSVVPWGVFRKPLAKALKRSDGAKGAMLVDKPAEHVRRPIGRVRRQLLGAQPKSVFSSSQLLTHRAYLGLPYRRGGLDVHCPAVHVFMHERGR